MADSQGSVTVQWRVPATVHATSDALTFTGIERPKPQRGSGTVVVTVPHAAAYLFLRVP